jgi:putative Ca2+/H+ antiporter (TMEM165/GDT1 family)
MDFRIVLSTLVAVFTAEMADKTQMVGLAMSSETGKPLSVFFGSVAGYCLVTGVTVFLGASLSRHINPMALRYGSGVLFILMGAWILIKG